MFLLNQSCSGRENLKEVKFRALTLEGKIITNIGCIEFFEDGSIIVNEEIPVKKLLQYAGAKNENNEEIYEEIKIT